MFGNSRSDNSACLASDVARSRVVVTPAEAAAHWRALAREADRQGRARALELRRRLPRAVALLREQYRATRVVLFGSLATDRCHANSDVDLAVAGLMSERYFAALGDLMSIFQAPVDLVEIEQAPASLRERIDSEGESL